jgi:hypothetical protein
MARQPDIHECSEGKHLNSWFRNLDYHISLGRCPSVAVAASKATFGEYPGEMPSIFLFISPLDSADLFIDYSKTD